MVAGTLALGMTLGVTAGSWCATHPRTVRARALEWVAMVLFCLPPWVAGFGVLLLFEPSFGVIHMPLFFDVHVYQEPYQNPWDWFRSLLVPWAVAGLPLAGACLRITLASTVEALDEDYMRTAAAKGLPHWMVVRGHGRAAALPTVLAFMSAGSAAVVLNVIMTETVFSVPGLLAKTRRALGDVGGVNTGFLDVPTVQLVSIWGALLIVVIGIVFDLALVARDPRVRAAGRPG
jgi:peptide/nickel transport system permease protein